MLKNIISICMIIFFLSGKYNFESCKCSLNTNLRVDYFRFMLTDYHDIGICDFLEYGFPIGYFGNI